MPLILGLNAYHADAAAALICDGRLVAAVEEERLRRVKHWAGLPTRAAAACLALAGAEPRDLDAIAVNRRPGAALGAKALFALNHPEALARLPGRLANRRAFAAAPGEIAQRLGPLAGRVRQVAVGHHMAHLASAAATAPWEDGAAVSIDGFGDFLSTQSARVRQGVPEATGRVAFPHSLGVLYQAVTQHLGFPAVGDEYKVMGLAAHGRATRVHDLERLVRARPGGRFALDLSYFRHTRPGFTYRWQDGAPAVGPLFAAKASALLGPARRPEDPVGAAHADLAASLQAIYERMLWHVLRHAARRADGARDLALAGGCAHNVVANAKIPAQTPFERVHVPPAPGDAGGAVGAALVAHRRLTGRSARVPEAGAYLGPPVTAAEIETALDARAGALRRAGCRVAWPGHPAIAQAAAQALADGELVGWVQGRMEWGPRALGARSLLADPRRSDVRALLNARIKRREDFRPFAASVLQERMADWFETGRGQGDLHLPWMTMAIPVRADRRARVPGVVHADGTSRPQSVAAGDAPIFHDLIRRFEALTGWPCCSTPR